jgi:hypothetical protein
VNLPALPPALAAGEPWRERLPARTLTVIGLAIPAALILWGPKTTAGLLLLAAAGAGWLHYRSVDIQRRQIIREFGETLGAFNVHRREAGMTNTDRRRHYGDHAVRAPGWPRFDRWVPKWDRERWVFWVQPRHITSLGLRPAGGMNPAAAELHEHLAVCAANYWRTDPDSITVAYQRKLHLIQVRQADGFTVPTGYQPPGDGPTPQDPDGFVPDMDGDLYGNDGPGQAGPGQVA